MIKHLTSIELPSRYKVVLELRFFLFSIFYIPLCILVVLYCCYIILCFPLLILLLKWFTGGSLLENGHFIIDHTARFIESYWKLFIPVDRTAPLTIPGLPLNFFQTGVWLAEVRSMVEPANRSITPLTFPQLLAEALDNKYPDRFDSIFNGKRGDHDMKKEQLVNTLVSPKFLPTVKKELAKLQKQYGQ